MVILAREMGFSVDLASVAITALIPQSYFALSVSEFLAKMSELDAGTRRRHRDRCLGVAAWVALEH